MLISIRLSAPSICVASTRTSLRAAVLVIASAERWENSRKAASSPNTSSAAIRACASGRSKTPRRGLLIDTPAHLRGAAAPGSERGGDARNRT